MKDRLGRDVTYLRVSVTELCNLRCRYCMPEAGVCKRRHEDMMTQEELLRAVRAAASLGIRKVRVTGGEPLVKRNLLSICRGIAEIPGVEEVCLTTNGTLLPPLARDLRAAGVRRVNLSLDTLRPDRYAYITRRGDLSQALAGLEAALAAGFDRVKVNAVLIGGFNEDEIEDLANLTIKYPIDVRFIELMPMESGTNWGEGAFLSCDAVLTRLPRLTPEADDGGVARLYRLPGAQGQVGLIRPVSDHFCAACSRLRLTADGRLKPCLHTPAEYPIRGLTQAEMAEKMAEAILAKPACHGALSAESASAAGRPMNEIGG